MSLALRLAEAREALKLSQAELAAKAGVSQGTIGNLEAGARKNPRELLAIAKALNVEPEWLKTGKGPKHSQRPAEAQPLPLALAYVDTVEPGPDITTARMCPVVGRAIMGEDGYYEEEGYPVGHGDGYIPHPTRDPHAYALRVVGDSMYPAIRNGMFVVCEPGHQVVPGDYVHIQLKNGRKMVKELLFDKADAVTVMSINPKHGRESFERSEIEKMHYVGGIYPASKRRL